MKRSALFFAATVAVLFVGGAVLKSGDSSSTDPTASVANGAPRGLLGLALLLADTKREPVVLARFDDELPALSREAGEPRVTFLVPPPERTAWNEAEAKAMLDRVAAGDHLVVLCDDESERNDRLRALLEAIGAECTRADIALGDESVTKATGVVPGYARVLHVRGTGRARPKPHATTFPAWVAGNESVVVKSPIGQGVVTVVGSVTPWANDGLAEADNAAFALDELAGRVVVDERHHSSRSRATLWTAIGRSAGPITAIVMLALLVPLSLLSLAPRPGDPPRDDDVRDGAPAALAQARALAALLAHAKHDPSAPHSPTTTKHSASNAHNEVSTPRK